ncbi:MAG: hypothetical protein PF569_06680 [Candidatus Woesearchaeota archaeon]|jgi:hypothetical protein|nr:hypothetical protein [Candidatus Woesearchaeota archaeon]
MSLDKLPLIIKNRGLIADMVNALAASKPKLNIENELIAYNLMRYFIPEFNPILNKGGSVAIQDKKGRSFLYRGNSIPRSLGIRHLDELSGANLAYFCEQAEVEAVLLKPEEAFGFESFYKCLFNL